MDLFTPERVNVINILVEEGFFCGWKLKTVDERRLFTRKTARSRQEYIDSAIKICTSRKQNI